MCSVLLVGLPNTVLAGPCAVVLGTGCEREGRTGAKSTAPGRSMYDICMPGSSGADMLCFPLIW